MNFKKAAIAAAVTASLGVTANAANADAIGSLSITGGTFAMGVFTPSPNPITFTSGVDLVGGYTAGGAAQGSNNSAPGWDVTVAQAAATGTAIAGFDFNGGGTFVNTYTNQSAVQATVGGGGPVVNGTFSNTGAGSISFDFSSFFANWNGNDFNQGNAAVSGSTTGGTAFTASWLSPIVGGPFNGQTGTWNVSGTVGSAVPVPAAAWLMGSGLVGLAGIARRKRSS